MSTLHNFFKSSTILYILFFSTFAYAQFIPPLSIQDEGGVKSKPIYTINCVGGDITCTKSGTTGIITISTSGTPTFDAITSGTNTTAAMVVGTGGSLATSGSGTIVGTDLSCTDCVGTTEIADSYLLNNGDVGTGTFDLGGATLEIPNSISLPGTCTVGEVYMDTDATSGQRIYACESINTWALQGDGGAGGGDSITVDTVAVVDPDFASTADIDFINTANVITANVNADSVALTTDTTGNYAAGDAEAGAALTGDTATAFFSTGQIERAIGGTATDTSAYGAGLLGSDGSNNTIDVDTESELETALGSLDIVAISTDDITSANLITAVSNETGSGVLVFGTSPTFTTNITAPLIIGGTGTTQTLIYKTTTGIGEAGADHIFQVGNNGGTEAMRILNNGNIGIAMSAPVAKLQIGGTGNVGIGTTAPASVLQVVGDVVIVPKKTADPCVAGNEGGVFYNDTSNYMCYCNGTNDVKMADDLTACF